MKRSRARAAFLHVYIERLAVRLLSRTVSYVLVSSSTMVRCWRVFQRSGLLRPREGMSQRRKLRNHSLTHLFAVEGRDDVLSAIPCCEGELCHDCRLGDNNPALEELSADLSHDLLDICGGGAYGEVGGHDGVRAAAGRSTSNVETKVGWPILCISANRVPFSAEANLSNVRVLRSTCEVDAVRFRPFLGGPFGLLSLWRSCCHFPSMLVAGFAEDDRGFWTPLMRLSKVGFCDVARPLSEAAPDPDPLALRPRLPRKCCASASCLFFSRASLTKSANDAFWAMVAGRSGCVGAGLDGLASSWSFGCAQRNPRHRPSLSVPGGRGNPRRAKPNNFISSRRDLHCSSLTQLSFR